MPVTNLQNSVDFKGQKFYVGLDVHKRSWAVTIRSMNIQLARFTQQPDVASLVRYLQKNYPGGDYYSAYEAGFCGTTIHEQLCKLGVNNIVIHAADMPITDKLKKNKTDQHDSRAIAENLEKDNLHGIQVLSREQQELRSLFRLRESKVEDVTRSNNRLKSFLMFHGIELPEDICRPGPLSLKALKWLDDLQMVSAAGTITLQLYVQDLKVQRKALSQIIKLLREQIQQTYNQTYQCLLSVPGIGAATTMGLIAEIGDFNRFEDPDQYCSFLGLCPWTDSSGDVIKTKGLQPRCNTHLRPLLIEASWIAIRKSPHLFAYYSKHAVRSSKQAIVKVARRLALIARGVAISGQMYDPDHLKDRQQQKEQKKPNAKRFSSGNAEQHIKKQPGNNGLLSLPG